MQHQYDVIIVGAGLAGLRAAVEIGKDARVAVLTKVFATRSHSGAAQGGRASIFGADRQPEFQHVAVVDALVASGNPASTCGE